MKTLDDILNDMEQRVRENQPVSPANWLEAAIKINALRGDLDNDIADFEAQLILVEGSYIKQGEPQTKAKSLTRYKYNEDYNKLLKAKAKSKRIEEFLRLAKKRSMLNEFSI